MDFAIQGIRQVKGTVSGAATGADAIKHAAVRIGTVTHQ